jgi:hypothetical protein
VSILLEGRWVADSSDLLSAWIRVKYEDGPPATLNQLPARSMGVKLSGFLEEVDMIHGLAFI